MFREITRSPGHQIDKGRFQKTLNFKVGETFKGTVIQRLSGREVLVGARGLQFRAHTALNLQQGQQHHFQVKSLGTNVELKVLDGEVGPQPSLSGDWTSARESRARLMKILVELSSARIPKALSSEAKEALGKLTRLSPAVVYGGSEKDAAQRLMRIIQGSGLFWESKVARYLLGDKKEPWNRLVAGDLKGLLLSLEKTFAGREDRDGQMKALAQKIREALYIIEQDQFLNLTALREETGWFMFLPGLGDGGRINAEIFVEKIDEGEDIRFCLVMEFTHLGLIESTVAITHGTVNVSMFLEDETMAAYVSEQLSQLEKAFEKCGLRPGTITCGVGVNEDRAQMPLPENEWTMKPVHLII